MTAKEHEDQSRLWFWRAIACNIIIKAIQNEIVVLDDDVAKTEVIGQLKAQALFNTSQGLASLALMLMEKENLTDERPGSNGKPTGP